MATEVVMPQMGESIAEGTITKWLVKVGDKVERDQPLFEISTDKVDAEIPSPVAGTLLEIRADEGKTVPVNDVVALIGEEGEGGGEKAEKAEPEPEPKAEEPAAAAAGEAEDEKDERAAEEREKRPSTAERTETARADAEPADVEAPPEGESGEAASEEERVRKFSSPLVRKIAQEEGVDLGDVEGTGIHGRVTKQDILDHLEQRKAGKAEKAKPAAAPAKGAPAERPAAAAAPAAARPSGASPIPDFHVPAYSEGEEVEIEPMSKVRQITAAHMRYSKDSAAHVTTVFHVDFSRVARARDRAKGGFQKANGTKLTFMPFIFKAVATALKKHKNVNASVDGTNIVYKKAINIGMAVDIPGRGLLVPVIKDADQLSITGLTKAANDLADRARGKKIGPDELRGGTFTVTNPGVFGSLFGTPVINQPQVAILGVGTIEKRPIVTVDADGNDTIAIKTMCYLSISYDHRVVDGADADRFMIDVKKVLEEDTWSELESYTR
jgi:pyruvate dehydrogenase E2 component (dihydrolipoamide acetyltransferase)